MVMIRSQFICKSNNFDVDYDLKVNSYELT